MAYQLRFQHKGFKYACRAVNMASCMRWEIYRISPVTGDYHFLRCVELAKSWPMDVVKEECKGVL